MTTHQHDAAPRLACRLLTAMLPSNVAGRSTLGDLIEEYHRRPRGFRRRIWFWAVTLEIVARYLPERAGGLGDGVWRDLVYATRWARRFPALTLATLISLSLAIGASTAAFTAANGTWLRKALASDPLVVVTWRHHKDGASKVWPAPEVFALRDAARQRTIEASSTTTLPVGSSADVATQLRARVSFVTGSYLSTFGARPANGRLLDPADDHPGASPVAVLDHLYWRRTFGGDRRIIGQPIWISGSSFTVVGIADREFVDPSGELVGVWVPVSAQPNPPRLFMISRLRADAAFNQGDAELDVLMQRLGTVTTAAPPFVRAESVHATSDEDRAAYRLLLIGLLSVIALVVVLACANVSNLQLASAAGRRQEIAIRRSCGAGRRRVVRQLLTESLLLAALAGVVGFTLARWFAPLMAIGMNMPTADLDPDLRIYGFVAIVTTLIGIGVGVAPAMQSARRDVSSSLKGSRADDRKRERRSRTKSTFIGVQAAASIVIVVMAALLVRTMLHLAWLSPGYDVDRLLNVSASFPRTELGAARATAFWTEALERVRALPGVEQASLAFAPPFGVTLGDPDRLLENSTDEHYFATLGLRLVAGRTYTAEEVASKAPVMLISEEVAHEYWRDENPVGSSARRLDQRDASWQVIGVVADAMNFRVHARRASIVYRPGIWPDAQLTVRTADPRAMSGAIRDIVGAGSTDVRPNVLVVGDRYARDFQAPRRAAALATAVAVLAMVLSVVGLSGVTMFSVRARTREIGIRLALGARRHDVVGMLVREGLRPVIFGLIVGIVVALMIGRVMAGMLYGLSARDPAALIGAVIVLLLAAVAAVILPTRRAARLDPAVVLRDS